MVVKTIAEKQKENALKYKQRFIKLRQEDPERAKREAIQELVKMGLFDQNGKRKEKIVSWD